MMTLSDRVKGLSGQAVRVVLSARSDDGVAFYYEGTVSEVGADYISVVSRFNGGALSVIALTGIASIDIIQGGWR